MKSKIKSTLEMFKRMQKYIRSAKSGTAKVLYKTFSHSRRDAVFTIEIIKCTTLLCLQDVILNMLFVHLSIPNLIILGILSKFLS